MRAQNKKYSAQDNQPARNDQPNSNIQKFEEFETNKQPSKKNQINLSDGLPMQVSLEQLYEIINQPAHNMSDKVVLLDARDRLVRHRKDAKEKQVSIKKGALKGTCLDMCPEKERYSRAEKRRLAFYEMLNSEDKDYEVDHRLAVKEYSRSSADQAEPLAHELRPLSVLQMTMDYLIAKILDRCDKEEENLAEWFNFLWDRMRGIRKDLTQQSLCELGSVDLVEKCARFHIHCTARLCELDMQDFDQKINDENLTKCLQTLKHMYYDLSLKNIFCPNEAEFRSYEVLLHLNDGEVLREVLQLRGEIRDSREVRNALKFVNALNSRNYVRFFKLARLNQDYLQSCLLQRYFTQIRSQAFQIMVQAYGPPKKGHLLLNNLANILGFEDENETASWSECYGLPIDSSKKIVKLDRSTFIEVPEKFPPMRRSSIIESKRRLRVSECIAKGLVPEDPTLNHVPTNSFDSNGYLLKETWSIDDHEDLEKAIKPSAPVTSSIVKLPTAAFTSSLVESFSRRTCIDLINSTAEEILVEVAQLTMSQTGMIIKLSSRVYENYLIEFIRCWCAELVNEVVLELKSDQVRKEERMLYIERVARLLSSKLYDEILSDVINQEIKFLGNEVMQEFYCVRADLMKENLARHVFESLVNETVAKESKVAAFDVAHQAIQTREEMVSRVSKIIREFRIRRWFTQWRTYTELKIRRRKEKQTFPACPSRMVFHQQIASLKSKGEQSGHPLKRKSLVQQSVNVKRFNSLSDLRFNFKRISTSLEDKCFDLFSFLDSSSQLCFRSEVNSYWKLVILSIGCEEDIGEIFLKWFGFAFVKRTRDGWIYIETRNLAYPLTICIRFVYNYEQISEVLRGAHGFIVVYNPHSDFQSILRKIAEVVRIQSRYSYLPVVSVASKFCSPEQTNPQILQSCLHVVIDFEEPISNKQSTLEAIFSNLVQADHKAPPLSAQLCTSTVWDLANTFVSSKILSTIYRDLKQRQQANLPHQGLQSLIEFSNNAIRHLIENVLLDSELIDIKWPPLELAEVTTLNFPPIHWNSNDYRQTVSKALQKYLILPSYMPSADNQDYLSLCDSLRKYCQVLATLETNSTALLLRVDSVLSKSEQLIISCESEDVSMDSMMPWTEVYQACIDYRLGALYNVGLSMKTAYFGRALEHIHLISSWSKAINSFIESTGQPMNQSGNQLNAKSVYLDIYAHRTKSLDLPHEISILCDSIIETSRQSQQEHNRFQERLSRVVNAHQHQPSRRLSSANLSLTKLDIKENLDVLEQKLLQSRNDDEKFESFLKRALGDA